MHKGCCFTAQSHLSAIDFLSGSENGAQAFFFIVGQGTQVPKGGLASHDNFANRMVPD